MNELGFMVSSDLGMAQACSRQAITERKVVVF